MGATGLREDWNGKKVWFCAADNTLVEVTVAKAIVRDGNEAGVDYDYTILVFNQDLPPSITPMAVISEDDVEVVYPRYSPPPYVWYGTCQHGYISSFNDLELLQGCPTTGGDSGSPNMLPMPDGSLVMFGGRTTSGPSTKMQDDMDDLTTRIGLTPANYRLNWYDLTWLGQRPTPANDSYSIYRDTPSDFPVLANDTDPDGPNALTILSVEDPNPVQAMKAGTKPTVSQDKQSFHFEPDRKWLGPVTFTYIVTDGAFAKRGTVTVDVDPKQGNTPPDVYPLIILDQTMNEDATIEIPFTASDDFSAGYLEISGSCTVPALIPAYNFRWDGQTLRIKAGQHQFGTGTVIVTVKDEDGGTTTRSFQVTVVPLNVPTLLANGLDGAGFHLRINGPANTAVDVKASEDLVTWAPLGSVTLNSGGLYDFVDTSAGSYMHRFYTARGINGSSSSTVGFVKVTVPAGQQKMVANQLEAPPNLLSSLLPGVPFHTQVSKWVGSLFLNSTYVTDDDDDPYWTSDTSLTPGEGALILIPGDEDRTLLFAGDVLQGHLVNPVPSGRSIRSCRLPRAGGIVSDLGYPASSESDGDEITQMQNGINVKRRYDAVNKSWQLLDEATQTWSPSTEPHIAVGESFWINTDTAKDWVIDYSASLEASNGHFNSASEFAFTINGAAGMQANVYSSSDLSTWTMAGNVTLSGGVATFTDSPVGSVPYRFYRVGSGTVCSRAYGFSRVQTPPAGWAMVANQLGTQPTLVSAMFDALPQGTVVYRWNGSAYETCIYTTDDDDNPIWTQDVLVALGEGVWVHAPLNLAIQSALIGEVNEGHLLNPVPMGWSIRGSVVPQEGGIASTLGFSPSLNDRVEIYDPSQPGGWRYYVYQYDDDDILTWIPSEPVAKVAEAFWIQTPAAKQWVRDFAIACP